MLLLSPQPSSPSPSGDLEGNPHTTGLEVGVAPLSMISSSEVSNVLCPQEGVVTTSGLSNRSPQKVCACVLVCACDSVLAVCVVHALCVCVCVCMQLSEVSL
jgi:hypothetical protein